MENAARTPQQILDDEHLRLLSIFYYVKGGITAPFACIPIIHVVLGLVFIIAPNAFGHGNDQPPEFLGWSFVILGSFLTLCRGKWPWRRRLQAAVNPVSFARMNASSSIFTRILKQTGGPAGIEAVT